MAPKILIVEDNFITSDEIIDRLHALDYADLDTAFNGEDAIEKATRDRPDLILMDVNLGEGIDGIEASARIKEIHDIPVIYLTAYDDEATLKRAKVTAPYAYVLKPFDERELHIAIEIAIYKHETEKRLEQALHEARRREEENSELLETLHTQNLQLQELNATKDTFFSIIAHDLKNPFMAIEAGTKMLSERLQRSTDELVRMMSHEVHIATKQISELLGNLLTWSRAQQGKISYTPESTNLATAANYCIRLSQENAAQKRISLTNSIDTAFSVHADGNMLNVILRNLISNAVKFTSDEGMVTVTAQDRGEMVEIAISDSGVGIEPDKIPRLFLVGERNISNKGTAGERGTGLGLILCKEFATQHGGEIWVESEEGRGSTFRFTLSKSRND